MQRSAGWFAVFPASGETVEEAVRNMASCAFRFVVRACAGGAVRTGICFCARPSQVLRNSWLSLAHREGGWSRRGLFDDRRLRIAHAFGFCQESFGTAETQVHVQPDGQVVLVICDVERDDFFFFAFFVFYE